jgi:leader peptidase (prepilin peptidase) / N-methyltransferase
MWLIEIGLVLAGLILGPFVNFGIYAWAYFPRPMSVWQTKPIEIADRPWMANLPILGWLFRLSESQYFGPLYWLRPFAIELVVPIGLVLLYRYCVSGEFSPVGLVAVSASTLQHQFMAYAVLITLMAIATFIDFDERTIPDKVTIPGTLLGLLGAVIMPDWRLHELSAPVAPAFVGVPIPLQANSPESWNPDWNTRMGLCLGLFFWSLWCFGMADRRWIMRRGVRKAFAYFIEVLKRSPSTKMLLGMWVAGLICLSVAYGVIGQARWESLLSSLFGMGIGGVLVWGFRIVARWAMGQEALGFGDVTLMAMIGSFFGWQIVCLAFFLAPFFSMVFVVITWIATRDSSLPFGPYLSAATLYCMLDWVRVWSFFSPMIFPPEISLLLFVFMLLALGAMLWVIQRVKQGARALSAR